MQRRRSTFKKMVAVDFSLRYNATGTDAQAEACGYLLSEIPQEWGPDSSTVRYTRRPEQGRGTSSLS
jgi:hypothetical protein